jgi:hypothetical protein
MAGAAVGTGVTDAAFTDLAAVIDGNHLPGLPRDGDGDALARPSPAHGIDELLAGGGASASRWSISLWLAPAPSQVPQRAASMRPSAVPAVPLASADPRQRSACAVPDLISPPKGESRGQGRERLQQEAARRRSAVHQERHYVLPMAGTPPRNPPRKPEAPEDFPAALSLLAPPEACSAHNT